MLQMVVSHIIRLSRESRGNHSTVSRWNMPKKIELGVYHIVIGQKECIALWLKLIPFLLTARPMTNLCWTCQWNNVLIYRGSNIPDEEKCERLKQKALYDSSPRTVSVQFNGQRCIADMCDQSAGSPSCKFSLLGFFIILLLNLNVKF